MLPLRLANTVSRVLTSLTGTGIQLLGNISQGTYDITLDGMPTFASSSPLSNSTAYITSSSANILASFAELPNANHTIQLTFSADTTATSSSTASLTSGLSYIAFDKAVVITEPTDTKWVSLSLKSQDYM